jgi:hypothetical protein
MFTLVRSKQRARLEEIQAALESLEHAGYGDVEQDLFTDARRYSLSKDGHAAQSTNHLRRIVGQRSRMHRRSGLVFGQQFVDHNVLALGNGARRHHAELGDGQTSLEHADHSRSGRYAAHAAKAEPTLHVQVPRPVELRQLGRAQDIVHELFRLVVGLSGPVLADDDDRDDCQEPGDDAERDDGAHVYEPNAASAPDHLRDKNAVALDRWVEHVELFRRPTRMDAKRDGAAGLRTSENAFCLADRGLSLGITIGQLSTAPGNLLISAAVQET